MKSKAYEKYREARESIKSGKTAVVIIDGDVSVCSTKLIKEGEKRWNEHQRLKKQIYRPN